MRWAARSHAHYYRDRSAPPRGNLFGIIQGGMYPPAAGIAGGAAQAWASPAMPSAASPWASRRKHAWPRIEGRRAADSPPTGPAT